MKSYLALAWKELKAQKITAILILVAVIMSTIMTTVIGQSIGILQSMRIQQAAGLNGNRYATFHQLGKEQAQKLHEDDRLYDVGDTIFIGSTPLGNSSLSLYLREYHDNALSMYPAIGNVKEGRLPEEAIEIALSEDTVYSNIHTRVGEIGMQRAIGMSAASLYKTFLWEGAYYGIIASVIGAVFGYVCCIFVGAAQTDALQLVAVPVMAIVEAAIISIVACLLATAIPLRSIARMSIVDSIETVE